MVSDNHVDQYFQLVKNMFLHKKVTTDQIVNIMSGWIRKIKNTNWDLFSTFRSQLSWLMHLKGIGYWVGQIDSSSVQLKSDTCALTSCSLFCHSRSHTNSSWGSSFLFKFKICLPSRTAMSERNYSKVVFSHLAYINSKI